MLRTSYKHLNNVQKGCFAEAFAKMAFTLEAFEVYNTEYDDRGIDFATRAPNGVFLSIQVKATDGSANPFIFASKFEKSPCFLLCAVRLIEGNRPAIYLARGSDWDDTSDCLAYNPGGGNAGPYYEMRFAKKHSDAIELLSFTHYIHRLRG